LLGEKKKILKEAVSKAGILGLFIGPGWRSFRIILAAAVYSKTCSSRSWIDPSARLKARTEGESAFFRETIM